MPRSLWHVVLFYTAGELTKQALAHRGVTYEAYLYKTGLFDRAWPMYRPAIEAVLSDFIAGKRTREDMAHALVRAVTSGQGQGLQGRQSVSQPAPSEGKPKASDEFVVSDPQSKQRSDEAELEFNSAETRPSQGSVAWQISRQWL